MKWVADADTKYLLQKNTLSSTIFTIIRCPVDRQTNEMCFSAPPPRDCRPRSCYIQLSNVEFIPHHCSLIHAL